MDQIANFIKQPVTGGHDASATTINVGSAASFPDPTAGQYNLTWWNSTAYSDPTDDPNKEIIRVTARDTGANTLTVTRAQEGTNATTKNTAAAQYLLILTPTKKTIDDLKTYVESVNNEGIYRQAIINGNFDIWQRGTSQTSNGYGSDDRWNNQNGGTTKTHTQQTFTLGQTDVPNNPKYYSRTVVTSVAGAGNYCLKTQRIEDVEKFSGKNVTVSFWAKADASKNIAIEFLQYFGTGGSPSAIVSGIGAQKIALTTSWVKYTATVAIPSISGKTLGSNNDDNLELNFWFDAGSTYNSRTDTLGQQSGTFDIAQVQLNEGSVALPFAVKSYEEELRACQRYYNTINNVTARGHFTVIDALWDTIFYPTMRKVPTATYVSGALSNCSTPTLDNPTTNSCSIRANMIASGVVYFADVVTTFDAEL